MDPRRSPVEENGPSPPSAVTSPPVRRRVSMDEDFLYQRIMTTSPRRPSQPPPYEPQRIHHPPTESTENAVRSGGGSRGSTSAVRESDILPHYSPSVELEGVFTKKHEIENTTKRAEDRHWHTRFVTLNGTALNIYHAKKDWGWGRTRDGPTISPDNPPWIKKGKLEKTYSLLHADAGIAADYKK